MAYCPSSAEILGLQSAQAMSQGVVGMQNIDRATLNQKPRMSEAFDDLERAIAVMGEVALHVASRTECLQRPRMPEPARTTEGGQIRAAVGPVVGQIESLTEKVRAITSGMQDTLQRLEV